VFECCLLALTHRPTIVLPLVYCPVDDTLFELGPEIRCSGVSSRYCCYGNHTAGSEPIYKLFIVVNGELNKVSIKKIISKRCELVKLCDIHCSDPVFLDTLESNMRPIELCHRQRL